MNAHTPANHFIAPSNFDESCHFCGYKIAPGTLTEEDANDGFAHAACLEAAIEDALADQAADQRESLRERGV